MAVEGFFHYGDRWRHYRRTVELLKSHGWQLFELAGRVRELRVAPARVPHVREHGRGLIVEDVEVYSAG